MTDRGYLLDLLDLLEGMQNVCGIKCPDYIAQLRERLAQEDPWVKTYCGGKPNYTTPVHTSKHEWVGLTDEDFADMVVITLDSNGSKFDSHMFARYVEAVLREKNK